MSVDYRDRRSWSRKCWVNVCRSGIFSSDRTISDYAEDVWRIEPTSI